MVKAEDGFFFFFFFLSFFLAYLYESTGVAIVATMFLVKVFN